MLRAISHPAFLLALFSCFCPGEETGPATMPTAVAPGAITGWQPAGWGGGSYYWAAAWHPTDRNVLYMGSDSGGLFRSEDKGLHWSPANTGLCHYTGYSLAVSPAAPDLVYALTDGGLCKSIDRARSWTFIAESGADRLDIRSWRHGSVRAVGIDPRNAEIVYAGSHTGRLFKSEDGGTSWRELPYREARPPAENPPAPSKAVKDVVSSVALVPGEAGTVYVSNTRLGMFRSDDAGATWSALDGPRTVLSVTTSARDPATVWAACGGDGIWRSDDRGRTWTPVEGWRGTLANGSKALQIREVALHPARPGLVYAIGNQEWNGSLFRSDDGGTTWSRSLRVRCSPPGNPNHPYHGEAAKGFEDMSRPTSIVLDPADPDQVFIAANWRNVFSADGGRTLEERSTGADNTCHTDIRFLGGRTYVTAMDEGLFVSDDAGGVWRQLVPHKYEPLVSGHFWRVLAAPSGGSTRVVTTCSPWTSGSDPRIANRVFVSEDGGGSFAMTTAGLPDHVPHANCVWGRSYPRALAADPNDPQVLYLGMDGDAEPAGRAGGGVFRSADGGRSWTRCPGQPGSRRMFYGLAVDPTDSRRLFWGATGKDGGVWRSQDAGASWELVFRNETWIWNLEVTASGTVLAAGKNLWRSGDHGRTWKAVTSFPTTEAPVVVGIALDPADEQRLWISRTTWLAGGQGGIYRSCDGGASWQDITGDSPYRKPLILRYNPATRTLWAGGAGLYKLQQ
jgi:photosystem II stability/assembly factor-like uncharacterized protein